MIQLDVGVRDDLAGGDRPRQDRDLDQFPGAALGRQAKADLIADGADQERAEAPAGGLVVQLLDGDLGRLGALVGERQARLLEAQIEGLARPFLGQGRAQQLLGEAPGERHSGRQGGGLCDRCRHQAEQQRGQQHQDEAPGACHGDLSASGSRWPSSRRSP